MRLKHMNVRVLLSSLLAVLALSAVAASAAQASVEGPFFKDGATRLLEGESKEFKLKNYDQEFYLSSAANGIHIVCKKVAVASGAKLLGSSGANSAAAEGSVDFSECIYESQLQCKITGGAFKTAPLKFDLAYSAAARKGDLEVVLKPAKGEKFATVTASGECFSTSSTFEGDVAADVAANGSPVAVGSEPAVAKGLQLLFPTTPLRKAWVEKAGSLVESEIELDGPTSAWVTSGLLEAELTNGAEWGVFS